MPSICNYTVPSILVYMLLFARLNLMGSIFPLFTLSVKSMVPVLPNDEGMRTFHCTESQTEALSTTSSLRNRVLKRLGRDLKAALVPTG